MNTTFHGSRKHILDLIDSPQYLRTLNTLLKRHALVSDSDVHEPVGLSRVDECEIPDFCRRHCSPWFDLRQLDGWWLPAQRTAAHRPKGATWDLLSTCSIGDRHGLLLVEAKAHEKELAFQGKILDPAASEQSALNHNHISDCLATVTDNLRKSKLKVSIGVESHYQLANRIAWAWKLADCGVPVVLLYLAFLGDTYFTDHFKDADHWQRTMGAYMHGIVPKDLPGRCVEGRNGGAFTLLVESVTIPTGRASIDGPHEGVQNV